MSDLITLAVILFVLNKLPGEVTTYDGSRIVQTTTHVCAEHCNNLRCSQNILESVNVYSECRAATDAELSRHSDATKDPHRTT